MAKQKGILPLVGTIGGINFYYLNGKPVARKAGGGFNGKAIKTKSSMQRVRENSTEFGHCARVNKAFRQALQGFYTGYTFTYLHSSLMRLFTQLKDLDALHARGARSVAQGVATAPGRLLLQQFNYTPACAVTSVLPFSMQVTPSTYVLTLTAATNTRLPMVAGATHVQVSYGVLDFNFETLAYALHMANPVLLTADSIPQTLVLSPKSLPAGIGVPLPVLGVRYYQMLNGALHALQTKSSVGFVVL